MAKRTIMFTPSGYAFSGRKLAENLSKIRSLSNAIQVLLEHVRWRVDSHLSLHSTLACQSIPYES